MGQLTNLYVSQSYQGLLKLADSTSGVTSTLQSVQDGLGNNIPIKVSNTQVTITGSFYGDASGLTGITATSASYALNATSASYALNATSASHANHSNTSVSASHALNANNAISSSQAANAVSASQAQNAVSASQAANATSASFAQTSVSSSQAQNAVSSSQAQNAVSASQSQNSVSSSFASNATSASYSNNSTSASFAQNALSASWAPDNSNRNGLITTGSVGVTQTILGSLQVNGTVSATSASFTYVNTVYETASVIYSSGSNQLGDASNDTQTLWGTVNLPSGPLVVTGSVTATNFTGSLQGTASYATNALSASQAANAVSSSQAANAVSASQAQNAVSASQAQNAVSASQAANAVSASQAANAVSASQAQNAVSASQAQNAVSASWAVDFNKTGLITTASIATTQAITGSVIISGSHSNTGSLGIRNGNLDLYSNNTTVNTSLYLTSSLAGQANLILGWGDNPGQGGAGATQANYTGSLRITGSNNIVSMPQIRATGLGGAAGLQGYLSGSHNIINGNQAGIYLTTSSLLFPKTSANFLNNNGSILMTFTTSSLAAPIVSNNGIFGGGITVSHPSGSVVASSNIMVGQVTSTQNFVTNTVPSISSNNILGAVTLNHISSSISFTGNYTNAPVTVNNHLSSSNITNNSLAIGTNHFVGGSSNTGVSIWVSGSQNSNQARNIIDNLIGGKNITVSSSFVSSSNSNLVASVVYGQNLSVSGSHAPAAGGSAFFGRYNGLNGLEDTQNIVFAVGTGTSTGTRRTGLYIDSGSNIVTSGSFTSIGNATVTGSLNVTGSVTIANAGDLTMYGHKMFNVGAFLSTQTQSGSANVSQSINYNTTDYSQGVSVVSGTRLTVANAGVYNIQFSAQVLADTGADDVYIWLKKNGTNISNSAGRITLANNEELIAAWNYVVDAAASDYYEICWQTTDANIQLINAAASGNIPDVPSVIVTVTQVR